MSGRDCLAHASFAAYRPSERFWRTIKYEEVYLRAYDGVEEARQSIGRYIAFYNARRCRSARQHNPRPTIHLTTRHRVLGR